MSRILLRAEALVSFLLLAFGAAFFGLLAVNPAQAEPVPIIGHTKAKPFFATSPVSYAPLYETHSVGTSGPSLFAGRAQNSFFAPFAPRAQASSKGIAPIGTATVVDHIRYIIGQAESRKDGYDAVQHGAKIRPSKKPTQMTLREIYAWIDATPGQPHAIGRYQFIPDTLRRLVGTLGVPLDQRFTPQLQDTLSDLLLVEAGFLEFQTGHIARHTFMNNLAKIWAGLPTSNGKSYYHGYAGNKATMTWASFDAQMKALSIN